MAKSEISTEKNLKLNLGCEDQILPGFINVDLAEKPGVLKLDLSTFPLPFKTSSCKYILASHLLEHLDRPTEFMLELHRISQPKAVIDLFVPHFSSCAAYADLSHKRPGFSYLSFGNQNWNKELNKKFITIKRKIYFTRSTMKFLNYIFNPIINLFPVFYERFFAFILPCSQIHFRLIARK